MPANFPITKITPPIPWVGIQNALTAWAQKSGLLVKWARQTGGAPDRPYIDLKISGGITALSDDEFVYRFDPVSQNLFSDSVGQRQFTLAIQCFCKSDNPDSSPTGTMALQQWTNAEGYLSYLQSELRRPATHDLLLAAGVAVIQPDPITILDDIAFGQFQSRASMDVRLACASNFVAPDSDGESWIDTVSGTGSLDFPPSRDVTFTATDA